MNPDSLSLARRLVPTYDPNEEHRFSIHQAVFDELGAQHATPNADYGRARRAYIKLRFKYNNNSKMIFLCQRVTLHILDNSLLDRTQHVVAIQIVTKTEFRSSKTHEFEAIVKITPAVQANGISVASCHGL